MFSKLLVANRGEIALRVIRSARAMGIRSVAVFSEADRGALHVRLADEARPIGPAPARESYLDAGAILAAARDAGADALHPGYGFLAENAEFARAVAAAGLVFVGPEPETLEAVGDKIGARRAMASAGVPVLPGSDGPVGDAADARAAAESVGWPILLKPAAGGGGKGMRRVDGPETLERELAAAMREAEKAFGDGSVYVEKFIGRVRHVEVQILGTAEGVLALGERECSIQRRHQKLVEETPTPADPAGELGLRRRLADAAVLAGEAVGYRNAGTVEFLLDEGGDVHFIEVNARLQVEHPVTEIVTGLDLVEAQLRLAAGEPLPRRFHRPEPRGWAVEVRILAEDPARAFLPSTGVVRGLRLPAGPDVRWDGAVEEGTVVTPHYDSLLGKLAVGGADRPAALDRLAAALDELRIEGLATNVGFLRRLLRDRAFREGELHTEFLAERGEALTRSVPEEPERLAAAALLALGRGPTRSAVRDGRGGDRLSGWRATPAPFVWVR